MQYRRLALMTLLAGLLTVPIVPFSQPSDVLRQSVAVDSPATEKATKTPEIPLGVSQQAISRRYRQFEETLLKMAELMRKSDPDRTALLRRVMGKSKEGMITVRMDRLVELMEAGKLGDSIEQQDALIAELMQLLDLLGSEDRAKEIEEEKKRLKDLIRDVEKMIGKEKSIRAGTERGANKNGLQQRQADLAEQAKKLGKKIDGQDAAKAKKNQGEKQPDEKKPSEEKSKQGDKSKDGKPQGDKSKGDKSKGDKSKDSQSPGKQSKGGKSSDKQSKGGQPKPGGPPQGGEPPQKQQRQQPQTPGRQQIEQARKAMQDAAEKLKQNKREGASEDQTEAIAKLQQAKDKLEEILRQLREEERERLLTKLEDRFQQMLAVQLVIYDNTVRLGKIPEEDRETRHISKAKELSLREADLVIDAQKALALLKDEGSSVAFPEAVEQMRDDMRTVVGRLDTAKVGELTQGIEEDIIEALEELIESLQKEIEKGKTKRKQPPGQQGQKGNPALVDTLAELKMLRSLQLRINRRTKRLGRLFSGEQAVEQDAVERLRVLSRRQRRIQKATKDLATGKNK